MSRIERNSTIMAFMKRFGKIYRRVRKIMASGDSDALAKAKYYLEAERLNETIMLPSLP